MLFEDILESTKGVVTLMKNTWGYVPIHIETEGRFLKVSRQEISTEDFVGNNYEVEYFVRPEFLHVGRNYGVIRMEQSGSLLRMRHCPTRLKYYRIRNMMRITMCRSF